MAMKKGRIKRPIAVLLSVLMILSLMPFSALAAEGDYEPVASINTYSSLSALLEAQPDYKGEVVRYVAPHTGDNDTDHVRIDFGVYNLGNTTTVDFRFKFDPAIVTLLKADKTDISINKLNGTVNDSNKEAILAYCNYPAGTGVGDGAGEVPGTPVAGGDYSMFIKTSGPDIDVGATKAGLTGIFGFSFGLVAETSLAPYISVFYEDDGGCLNTETYNDVFYIASTYFKVNSDATVDGETFGLYKWALNTTGGFTQIGATPNPNIAFIGFPAPAAPTAKVDITGYATRNDAENKTNPAEGLTVELKQGDTVLDTYTTGAGGKLLKDGSAVGTLSLAAGTYTCHVTGGSNVPNDVTFTISESQAQNSETVEVAVYTRGSDEATTQYYEMTVTDKDMLGKPVKDGTEVTVTIAGAEQKLTVSEGKITVSTLPSSSPKAVTVAAEGYKTQNLNITFDAGRAITVANVSLEQVRTKIELEVPVADPDTPVYVVIDKQPGGTVTDGMAMELPITVVADETGKVVVELPDGDYTYTIQTPGAEDVEMNLDVDNTGLQNNGATTDKVTISDPENPGTKTELTPSTGTGGNTVTAGKGQTVTGDQNASNDTAALPKITDPLYATVGEWTANGMTVEIYLQNTKAMAGTFGMSFDTSIFDANNVGITWGTDIEEPSATDNQLVLGGTGGTQTLTNPVNENGNLLFYWRGKSNVPVDASASKVLLATVELKYASGQDQESVKPLVTKETLNSLAFASSAWSTQINNYYGTDANAAAAFSAKYWRPVDGSNIAGVPNRLESAKAIHNGFYETYSSADNGSEGLAEPQDTRQQFVFQTFSSAKNLQFKVEDTGHTGIPNATVQVFKKDDPSTIINTGTTGPDGTVSIAIPADTDVDYKVTAPGYLDATGSVPEADQDDVITVTMTPALGHDVEIHGDQTNHIQLVGGQAYNGQDYYFTLDAKPGYAWPDGNLPAAGDLTIKLVTDTTDWTASTTTYTASWDSAKNQYKIDGSTITAPDGKLVIRVDDTKDPEPDTTQYTVTVTSGAHGTFSYNADSNGSTFAPSGTTTGLTGTLTETLTATGTTSAKYSFAGDGPIDDANQDLKDNNQQYEAWVVYTLTVNGTDVPVSDYDKINGVKDYQITGIDRNQTINVTYGKAIVEGDVIIDGPDPDPTDKANVTVILSAYGEAAVNSGTAWPGADNKSYAVDAGSTFSAVFTGKSNVSQPDGSTQNYEIDSVMVDGTKVNVDGNSLWTNTGTANDGGGYTSGTLNMKVLGGENYTVVVTFKPVGKDPIFAVLEVVNRTGNGGTVPTGQTIQNVGLPATVTVSADTGYKLSGLDLTEPGGAIQDVMPTDDPIANPYVYTTPNLKAGTTTVGASFQKDGTYHTVKIRVQYMASGANVTAATLTFTDSTGDQIVYGPDKTGAYQLQNPMNNTVEYEVSLLEETYTVMVSKKGYLTYTITGFQITSTDAGDSADTAVKAQVTDGTICFGQASGTDASTTKAIEITLGDATWDGKLVGLDDIAQVANGLQTGASAGQQKRADLDESGSVAATDMSYVVNSYARRSVKQTYAEFMK